MFFRVVTCCIGFTATFVLSAFGGPFDSYVGKYKGRGVERSSDGISAYFAQTVKVEGDSQLTNYTLPGVVKVREFIRFRENGRMSGSGSAFGYGISWTVRGRWRQEGDAIKTRFTTWYSDGSYTVESRVHRFRDGKLMINGSASSNEGGFMTSSYKGKLVEAAQ